jgi:hypothetical protein
MLHRFISLSGIFGLLAFFTGTANAAIISSSGDLTILDSPPADVRKNKLTSTTEVFAFFESSTVLDVDLAVNSTAIGLIAAADPDAFIAGGTEIQSWYVHADLPKREGEKEFTGTIAFDVDILGVIFQNDTLVATHDLLGNAATNYGSKGKLNFPGDSISISEDRRSIDFSFTTSTGLDILRILSAQPSATEVAAATAPTPTPLALLAVGWAALARIRRAAAGS